MCVWEGEGLIHFFIVYTIEFVAFKEHTSIPLNVYIFFSVFFSDLLISLNTRHTLIFLFTVHSGTRSEEWPGVSYHRVTPNPQPACSIVFLQCQSRFKEDRCNGVLNATPDDNESRTFISKIFPTSHNERLEHDCCSRATHLTVLRSQRLLQGIGQVAIRGSLDEEGCCLT